MDVSKAFHNNVAQQELLYKLSNYGINNITVTWLKSFKQRVVLGGVMSDHVPVSSGVQQGSVLGPFYS